MSGRVLGDVGVYFLKLSMADFVLIYSRVVMNKQSISTQIYFSLELG